MRDFLKVVQGVVKNYFSAKRLMKNLVRAPFDAQYLRELIEIADAGDVVIEIMQPDTTIIRIRKEQKQAPQEYRYYQ